MERGRVVMEIHDLLKKNCGVHVVGLGLYREDKREVEYRHLIEDGKWNEVLTIELDKERSVSGWCLKHKRDLIIDDMDAWMKKYSCNQNNNKGKNGFRILY